MADSPARLGPQTQAPLAQSIASAPGDLPMPDIEARFESQRTQFRHDNTIRPLAPRPGQPVQILAVSGEEVDLTHAALYYTVDGSEPDLSSSRVPMEIDTVDWDARTGFLTRWRGDIPPQVAGTTVRYRIAGWTVGQREGDDPPFWAMDGQGFWFRFPEGITTFAFRVEEPHPPLPHWAQEAVIYHIFLDRFHPGTPDGRFKGPQGRGDRHGGTLRGVIQALPYLKDLGVTCLWLSPLHPSDTYHRYDGKDYFAVDPDLGTLDDLRELTVLAHEAGMRVLLDFVPSHCSWRHPAFVAAREDLAADTAGWFTFDRWPDRYRCFLQAARNLPSFNTDHPGAREYLIRSARFWVEDCGVDGFRLDHAIAPSMDFWVAFQAALEEVKPDVVTIAEATDTPDALRRYRGKLNAVLDFPLARALRLTFAVGRWDVGQFDRFLHAYERSMAGGPGRVSFLDNHDMERFLFLTGGDTRRVKLGSLCQFTLTPTPAVYYGTEIGMSQEGDFASLGFGGDAEARRDMPWDPEEWDANLLDWYRKLIQARQEYSPLRAGNRATVHLDPAAGTYAYTSTSEQEQNLTVLNCGEAEARIDLPDGDWMLVLSTDEGAVLQGRSIILPAWSGALLMRECAT